MTQLPKTLLSSVLIATLLSGANVHASDHAGHVNKNKDASSDVFTQQHALDNLNFSAAQYSKLINNIDTKNGLMLDRQCEDNILCVPRSQDDDKIHMVIPSRWVVGFYPGALWMLLNHAQQLPALTNEQSYSTMLSHAKDSSELLFEQAKRTDTHDLGFMIDAPLVYALQNKDVPQAKKEAYQQAIKEAENNLLARFAPDQPVMKSWDFIPRMKGHFMDASGKETRQNMDLAAPWRYPVIVDNMMNMEILLKSSNPESVKKAFSHASATMENHFFYEETDTEKLRPIAYHVFDYAEMKSGNWQGLGNRSAWARGQAWALYGYVVSAIYASEKPEFAEQQVKFEKMVEKLYTSTEHFTQANHVPIWDYFASRSDAHSIASYAPNTTARYSRILDLCLEDIDAHVLPYQGFAPISYEKSMLAPNTLETFKEATSPAGEAMLSGNNVRPCGTKPYYLDNREIPYDTSAAGVFASALYRMAGHTKDADKAAKYEGLADRMMLALTREFRTDIDKGVSYDLGFVLRSATGHLPEGSEVDVPIVYGDYYFIEANINKLALANK